MSRSLLRRVVVGLAALGLLSTASLGQNLIDFTDQLEFEEPEAWAMKHFASISLLTALGPVLERDPGEIDLGLELMSAPYLDAQQRTVGFGGLKEEDLNRSPAWVRVRASFGLPRKLTLVVGATPPVEVDGVKAALLSLAVERPLWQRGRFGVGGRLYGQVGSADGDLTCSQSEAQSAPGTTGNLFGCENASNDEVTLEYLGFELSGSYQLGDGGDGATVLFGGLATQHLDLEFQVDALTFGVQDRTRLVTDGWTWSLTAGARFAVGEKMGLSVEGFFSPLDIVRVGRSKEPDGLTNLRALISYRLR